MYQKSCLILLMLAFADTVSHSLGPRPLLSSRQADGATDVSAFLRRAYHASAVLNGHVFIDGGEFSYQKGNDTVYEYSNTLLSIDLANDWTADSAPLISSPKPSGVPNLSYGGIWVDRRKGALYTGFAGTNPHFGDQAFSPQGLWSFTPDKSAGGTWTCLNGSTDGWFTSQPRPYQGQVTSGHGYGFFMWGIGGNSTGGQTPSSTFITYSISDKKLTNAGAPGPSGRQLPASMGAIYVPNWGNEGVLVAVGGSQEDRREGSNAPGNNGQGNNGQGNNGQSNNGQDSFQTVHVYDVNEQRWYEQKTTGDIPEPRKDFCIAGSPSSNRTHEILVYAGWNGQLGAGAVPYDSAYVLTLPGFYWAKADYAAAHPRHGLSCNAVGGSQILAIGGVDTTQNGSDSYAAGFKTRDPFPRGLAIFDLGTLAWSPSYQANRPLQPPASKIQAYYNAKGLAPEQGFSNSDLQTLFDPSNFHPSSPDLPDPTIQNPPSPSNSTAKAAIIGGTIGGVAAIALATSLAILFYRRRRRQRRQREQELQEQQQQQGLGPETDNDDDDGMHNMAVAMGLATNPGGGGKSGDEGEGEWYRGVVPTCWADMHGGGASGGGGGGGDNGSSMVAELDSSPVCELDSSPVYELEGDCRWPEPKKGV